MTEARMDSSNEKLALLSSLWKHLSPYVKKLLDALVEKWLEKLKK